jgi:integrase
MRGSLREKRSGVWEVRVEVGRDPVTGRRRQLSRTVHGNKRAAQRLLNKLASDADLGLHIGTDATFVQLTDRWLVLAGSDLSPTTVRRYHGLLRTHILPALGPRRVSSIRPTHLDDLYRGLMSASGLSPATVRQVHAVIRRALRQAVRWGWIATNPAANATPPRVTRPTLTPPTVEELAALLTEATRRDPELGRLLHLAVATGARRGELCALRWSNLDNKRRSLTIERSIIEVPGGLAEKDTKTHAARRIALDPSTIGLLAAQRQLAEQRAAEAECVLTASAYVFSPDPDGARPWSPDHLTKSFQTVRSAVGLDSVRLHDLRHFAATRLLAAGVPVRTVSGRLGHANASTTLTVYAHFLEASDQAAAAVMGELLRSA